MSHMSHATHTGEASPGQRELSYPGRDISDKSDLRSQALENATELAATKARTNCDKSPPTHCCLCHQLIPGPPTTWWGTEPCHHSCGLTAWEQAWAKHARRSVA